jgi:hypothetical protein
LSLAPGLAVGVEYLLKLMLNDGGGGIEILNETPRLVELTSGLLGFTGRCRLSFG